MALGNFDFPKLAGKVLQLEVFAVSRYKWFLDIEHG